MSNPTPIPQEIWDVLDLFCGAGGVTEGIERIDGITVKTCINHDPIAIRSHEANHPHCKHYIEDIVTKDITDLGKHKVMWMSPDCTHFSLAKGGGPRDADSRSLPNQIFRYVNQVEPDIVPVENVKEFRTWGPLKQKLDKDGNPVFKKDGTPHMIPDTDISGQGIYYKQWVAKMKALGYNYRYKLLNAADYGAYTSRVRYFGIFAKPGIKIVFPKQTHHKSPPKGSYLKKWKAVREVLDLDDVGNSIIDRKKPLVEATLKRIYAGLEKFGGEPFIEKAYSGSPNDKVQALDKPSGSLTTIPHERMVFLTQNYLEKRIGARNYIPNGPFKSIVTQDQHQICFVTRSNGGDIKSRVEDLNKPSGTITCQDNRQLFFQKYHGNGNNVFSADEPASTLTTKDRLGVVFVDNQYGKSKLSSVEGPAQALVTNPKQSLVKAHIHNPQFSNKGNSIHKPCPTIVAVQDKKPLGLVLSHAGDVAESPCSWFGTDSPTMVKIKTYMRKNGIADITMRMLRVDELKQIQGFPKDYQLHGSQKDQKKHIGNSVECNIASAILRTLYEYNL